jgi:pimeloyl-ACP methyl ester carboxylesterase
MKKTFLWAALALLLTGWAAWHYFARTERFDTRYTGAFRLDGHSFLFIAPDSEDRLRYRTLSGQSGLLWPAGKHRFTGGRGWDDREPLANTFTFEMDANGHPAAVTWEQRGVPAVRAPVAAISEETGTLRSGELKLRYKFVRPAGQKPQASVVIIYGFERSSAVDQRFEPYLYAASGFATLVYDQRGTGESQGEYTQNFDVLSDDAVAALQWVREQPRIDDARVQLAAFDAGGWVASLAAAKDKRVRGLLVNGGAMVPVVQADRWRYVRALREQQFGGDVIAQVDKINAVLSDSVDRGVDRWSELNDMLAAAHDEPWFAALAGSDSLLGQFANSRSPLWFTRLAHSLKYPRTDPVFIDRLYDPLPTALAFTPSSYWIFGENDARMPTQWTLDALNTLQKRGRPIDYLVYPGGGHDGLRMETLPDGTQRVLGYEPDYFKVQVDWLRRNGRG